MNDLHFIPSFQRLSLSLSLPCTEIYISISIWPIFPPATLDYLKSHLLTSIICLQEQTRAENSTRPTEPTHVHHKPRD